MNDQTYDLLASGIRDLVTGLDGSNTDTAFRVLGLVGKVTMLRYQDPVKYTIVVTWITQYHGRWPFGATRDIADRAGCTERTINRKLNQILKDDVFSVFLSWSKIH